MIVVIIKYTCIYRYQYIILIHNNNNNNNHCILKHYQYIYIVTEIEKSCNTWGNSSK